MVQEKLSLTAALPVAVEGLNILEDRTGRGSVVLKIHGPLDGRKIGVFDSHAAHDQTAIGLSQRQRLLGTHVVELARGATLLPVPQKIGRRLAAKRK